MASDTNVFVGTGRLTGDPEHKTTASGSSLTTFRMASNRWVAGRNGDDGREVTSFLNVSTWANLADRLADQLQKGTAVLIEGSLETREWEDVETGKRREAFEIRAQRVTILRGGRSHGGDEADV